MSPLTVNHLEPNQLALRWLKAAEEAPADGGSYLYLLSLAHWGLENGVRLNENPKWGILHEDLDTQVGLLLGVKDQAKVYRWLFQNPNGPAMLERVDMLTLELERAENPMEAAGLVLQTISSRMAAARMTIRD